MPRPVGQNGLSTNGVNTADFATWFQGDPARNDTLMQYVVRCGVRKGQSISYTDPATAQFRRAFERLAGVRPSSELTWAVVEGLLDAHYSAPPANVVHLADRR